MRRPCAPTAGPCDNCAASTLVGGADNARAAGTAAALLGDMEKRTIETLRRELAARGRSVLRRRRLTLSDEAQLLTEREPDWEDLAADQSAAALLDSLGEADRIAIARIQASIERIDRGTYGICLACGAAIGLDRLRAVPEAERCARCAEASPT